MWLRELFFRRRSNYTIERTPEAGLDKEPTQLLEYGEPEQVDRPGTIEYEGYLFQATGVSSVDMFHGDYWMSSVSTHPVPCRAMRRYGIGARNIDWERLGKDSPTLFPGVRYPIRDSKTGAVVAEAEYRDIGQYVLHVREMSIHVKALKDQEYRYSLGDRQIGGVSRNDNPDRTRCKWGDVAFMRWRAWCEGTLPHEVKTLLITLPFLDIC